VPQSKISHGLRLARRAPLVDLSRVDLSHVDLSHVDLSHQGKVGPD
jgi:uncharacterized protein YjbI with pentapeptide repeats